MKYNILDQVISFVSPGLALERAKHRAQEAVIIQGKRAYEAATKGRRGDGWSSFDGNARTQNHDILKALTVLRERSIHGYKNNSSVFSAHRKIQNNVIGTGIMPTPVSVIGEKKLTKNEIEKIKLEWKSFAETTACDWNNMLYMGGVQSLAMRTLSTQGEVFIMKQRDANSRIPFKLQVLSPSMVDHQKNSLQIAHKEGNFTVQGVEFDQRGRKLGYWIFNHDPKNDYALRLAPVFVPVSDMLQVFYMDFPDQVRGIPFGVPAMMNMRDLDDYEDAALMAMKASAAFAGVTTRPQDLDPGTTDTSSYNPVEYIEPGTIQHLAPGEEITFNSPPTPQSFAEYVTKNQQKNAAGFGITYEQLSGDMSNVNFSSGRMGWVEGGLQVEDWQYNMFIPQFCDKVWEWFIEGLQIRGVINKKVGAEWTPPGRQMLDPVKELNGLVIELKSGLVSWTEACKRRGYNPETLMEQIKADKEMFMSAGIEIEWILKPEATTNPVLVGPDAEGQLSAEDLKRVLDAYGVGVRAGTITPTQEDEAYFRKLAQFPDMGEAVIQSWKDDGGIRRPITLTPPAEDSVAVPAVPAVKSVGKAKK